MTRVKVMRVKATRVKVTRVKVTRGATAVLVREMADNAPSPKKVDVPLKGYTNGTVKQCG